MFSRRCSSFLSMSALSCCAVGTLALSSGVSEAGDLPRVLLLAADSTAANRADAQATLTATTRFQTVDVINLVSPTPTPTLAELLEYDAVLVWTNSTPTNNVALGDVLADYIDAGGGVVVASFTPHASLATRRLGGRWITGGYEIITAPSGAQTLSTAASLGTVALPDHPVMENVATLSGTGPFRPNLNATLTSHGVLVASWNNGSILAAVSNTLPGRVDLGLFPPSSAASATQWNVATDGATLMANALIYAMGPSGPVACNAADIATAGNPDPNAGPDGFLTGDDFDMYISTFFNETQRPNGSYIADLVDGDGNPPPDGFLTGSDFDYFLGKFFEGC